MHPARAQYKSLISNTVLIKEKGLQIHSAVSKYTLGQQKMKSYLVLTWQTILWEIHARLLVSEIRGLLSITQVHDVALIVDTMFRAGVHLF